MKDESNFDVLCALCNKPRGHHYTDQRRGDWFTYCEAVFSTREIFKSAGKIDPHWTGSKKTCQPAAEHVLPTDSEARKEIPLFSGVLNYFPLALAAVARHSKRGNDKHNPGQPLHWARGKSMDHLDCIARHLLDAETVGASGEFEEATAIAWRALAYLQEIEEKRLGKPWSRGSK